MRKYIIEKDYFIIGNGKHMIIKKQKTKKTQNDKSWKKGGKTQKHKYNAKKRKTRIAISNRTGKYKEKSEDNLEINK